MSAYVNPVNTSDNILVCTFPAVMYITTYLMSEDSVSLEG